MARVAFTLLIAATFAVSAVSPVHAVILSTSGLGNFSYQFPALAPGKYAGYLSSSNPSFLDASFLDIRTIFYQSETDCPWPRQKGCANEEFHYFHLQMLSPSSAKIEFEILPTTFYEDGSPRNASLHTFGFFYIAPSDRPNDNIRYWASLAAVPEPATWWQLVFGFTVLGGMQRARRLSRS